jgi:tetratricopeptide (TPR) repeat protein
MDCIMDETLDQALKNAIAAHKMGQNHDAVKLFNVVLKAQPKHPDANHNLGLIAIGNGNFPKAKAFFRTALDAKPSVPQFWISYIDSLIILGQIDDALAVFTQAKGLKAKGEGFDRVAHKLSKRTDGVIQVHAPSGEFLQPIIDLYAQGELQQALAVANKMLEGFPRSITLYNILGVLYARLMQYDVAIDNYKKAIVIKPDYSDAHYNMGNALKQKGDLDAAIVSYENAINLKPAYVDAHFNMGNVLKQKGDLDAAIVSYKNAINLKSDHADAYNNLGTVLQSKGNSEAAIDSYKKAIIIKPDYADAFFNLGTAQQAMGDLAAAINSYKHDINIRPDHAKSHYNMGAALHDRGDLGAAVESYKQAINIRPGYGEAYAGIGEVYLTSGDYIQSADFYGTSVKFIAEGSAMLEKTQGMLLKTLYFLDDKLHFYGHLEELKVLGQKNAIIGSFSCRASSKYGVKSENGFCSHPMDYIFEKSLLKDCNFEKTFVNPAKEVLASDKVAKKKQPLLRNGHQTAGNLFVTDSHFRTNVKGFIDQEIEKYRHKFKDSLEGFITHWPSDYIIYGWLVSMKNGGAIQPHMHENGWISGSIYINIPKSSQKDCGNLVLCVEDPKYTEDESAKSKKIVDLKTGSLCLFPSSLLHYTIPFESTEERIVLAFDVVPV